MSSLHISFLSSASRQALEPRLEDIPVDNVDNPKATSFPDLHEKDLAAHADDDAFHTHTPLTRTMHEEISPRLGSFCSLARRSRMNSGRAFCCRSTFTTLMENRRATMLCICFTLPSSSGSWQQVEQRRSFCLLLPARCSG